MTDSSALTFVKCVYKVTGLVGDTAADLDKFPDGVPISGSWTLTPKVDRLLMLDAEFPETIVPVPISGEFENSYLKWNGDSYIWLVESPRNGAGEPLFLWKFSGEYRYMNQIKVRDDFVIDPKPDDTEPDGTFNFSKFRT